MRAIQRYIYGIAALLLFVATASVLTVRQAEAATGKIYLSPANASVQNSGSFTVAFRVTPGTSIDTVTGSISYDSAKLTLVSVDCSGSPFTAFPSCPGVGNPVAVTGASLGGGVTGDSQVARLTFKAKVGSGSTTIGLSGNTATSGSSNNPAVASANISFTTPACPSGQTGTWPNCSTPPSSGGGGSSSGGTGTSSGASSGGSTRSPSRGSSGGSSSADSSGGSSQSGIGAPAPVPANVSPVAVKVADQEVQYSQARMKIVSDQPTQVYIAYGTDQQTYKNGPMSNFATSHDLVLDPSLLIPGTTYYYTVVSKDQQGRTTQTEVRSFRTKGLTIKVAVLDKQRQPLRNKEVTLYSEPRKTKTDDKGYATFTDVTPGQHHVAYKAGNNEYKQPVSVENTVQSRGSDQVADVQNIAIMMPVSAPRSVLPTVTFSLAMVVVAVAVFLVFRSRNALMHRFVPAAQPADIPMVIHSSDDRSPAVPVQPSASDPFPTAKPSVDDKLRSITGPDHPLPGSTITPQANNDQEQNR